jgi:hypothetical protein
VASHARMLLARRGWQGRAGSGSPARGGAQCTPGESSSERSGPSAFTVGGKRYLQLNRPSELSYVFAPLEVLGETKSSV